MNKIILLILFCLISLFFSFDTASAYSVPVTCNKLMVTGPTNVGDGNVEARCEADITGCAQVTMSYNAVWTLYDQDFFVSGIVSPSSVGNTFEVYGTNSPGSGSFTGTGVNNTGGANLNKAIFRAAMSIGRCPVGWSNTHPGSTCPENRTDPLPNGGFSSLPTVDCTPPPCGGITCPEDTTQCVGNGIATTTYSCVNNVCEPTTSQPVACPAATKQCIGNAVQTTTYSCAGTPATCVANVPTTTDCPASTTQCSGNDISTTTNTCQAGECVANTTITTCLPNPPNTSKSCNADGSVTTVTSGTKCSGSPLACNSYSTTSTASKCGQCDPTGNTRCSGSIIQREDSCTVCVDPNQACQPGTPYWVNLFDCGPPSNTSYSWYLPGTNIQCTLTTNYPGVCTVGTIPGQSGPCAPPTVSLVCGPNSCTPPGSTQNCPSGGTQTCGANGQWGSCSCSSGQSDPHSVCSGSSCLSVSGCGTSVSCSTCGCPTGQTNPHSECSGSSCVSVNSCGVSVDCSTCGCPSGQTNPHIENINGVCTTVKSCGTDQVCGCPTGQTNPHSICQNSVCTSVNSCGVTDCSNCGCPIAGQKNPHIENINNVCTSVNTCGTDQVCGCPTGQTNPYSKCDVSGSSCISVNSCGTSVDCKTCGCPSGQTNPHNECINGSNISVKSCGVSTDPLTCGCPSGQTNPHNECINGSNISVKSCGVSTDPLTCGCTSGSDRLCPGGGNQTCDANGQWGPCKGPCIPGNSQNCTGGGNQTCDANGQWGSCNCPSGQTNPNYKCQNGSCVSVNSCDTNVGCSTCGCIPGITKNCTGGGTQTCDANGQWGSCNGPCTPTGSTQNCPSGGTQTCDANGQWGSCSCSSGQSDPHSVCSGSSCLSVNGCGTSVDCATCGGLIIGNALPYADQLISGPGNPCTGLQGTGIAYFAWFYRDQEGDMEKKFTLQIDNNSDFSSPEVYRTFDNLSYSAGTLNQQVVFVKTDPTTPSGDVLQYNVDYYWRVMVQERLSNLSTQSSVWIQAPQTLQITGHPAPAPGFAFTPSNPAPSDSVSFNGASVCYNNSGPVACASYLWDFGDNSSTSTLQNPNHAYSVVGTYSADLQVCDEANCCSTSRLVPVKTPSGGGGLPNWKEISPFR